MAETELAGVVSSFVARLRDEGLAPSPDAIATFARSLAFLDPLSAADLYWTGRACFTSNESDIPRFDAAFRDPDVTKAPVEAPSAAVAEPRGEGGGEVASPFETFRTRSFDAIADDERAALNAALSKVRLTPPRTSRRRRPAARGAALDLRKTLRRSLSTDGEMLRRSYSGPTTKPRRVVLVVDVSGSMKSYSEPLLRFAHAVTRHHPGTETFCFGTSLTRVTPHLRRLPQPDDALATVASVTPGIDGGTRIAGSLRQLIRSHRSRALRGASVIVFSDGLERDDPAALGHEMRRLRMLAHEIVWLNPLSAMPSYQPLAAGMAASLPHIDRFSSGHNLAELERLALLLDRSTSRAKARL